MHLNNHLKDRAVSDFKAARKRFELYERFYLSLSGRAKAYLRKESGRYKKHVRDLQGLILPRVMEICPACKIQCCKLYTPELSIYIAASVGGFDLNDYLLARCDAILPGPCYENAEKNLCPFWDFGCILPADCRSFLCLQYFCDELKKTLDMAPVSESLRKIRAVLEGFSIGGCMR